MSGRCGGGAIGSCDILFEGPRKDETSDKSPDQCGPSTSQPRIFTARYGRPRKQGMEEHADGFTDFSFCCWDWINGRLWPLFFLSVCKNKRPSCRMASLRQLLVAAVGGTGTRISTLGNCVRRLRSVNRTLGIFESSSEYQFVIGRLRRFEGPITVM